MVGENAVCENCNINPEPKSPNQKKRMPQWLKIILVVLWVIVFALSLQIRKQFIVGGLVGFIHAGIFLYLLALIIKK